MPNDFENWLNGSTQGQERAVEVKPDGDAFLKWLDGGQAAEQGQIAPGASSSSGAPQPADPILSGNIEHNVGLGPATVLADEDVYSDILPGTGSFVLVPSTDEAGNLLSKEQMVERYRTDGRNYGTFDSRESAYAYQAEHSSEDTKALVRAQLLQSKGISLEQQAKDREMARRLGLPLSVISYQREWAENENAALMFEQYQGLMEFAAKSPENAAIAKGDMETLGKIAASKANTVFYGQDPLAELYRNSRLVGPEGEATLADRWAMGEIGRQQAALGRRYLEEGVDISEELARLDREMLPYAQKVVVQSPIEEFLGLGVESLPSQVQMYATGAWSALATGLATYGAQAAVSAAAGSAAGPVGTAAGAASAAVPAAAAARAGWIAGIAKEAYELESGNMAVTLLREKDADGNAMPREVIRAASSVYGLASSVIEAANEGLLLRLLGPLGLGENLGRQLTSDAGRASLKTSLKMALVNAAKDKSIRDTLIALDKSVSAVMEGGVRQAYSRVATAVSAVAPVLGRLAGGAVNEGATEAAQEWAAMATESNARLMSNMGSGTGFDANLPEDFWERTGEAFLGGMSGSLLLGAGPVIASSAVRALSAQAAANFAQQQNEFHAVVEQAALKQSDSELFEQKLAELNPDLQEQVSVPMDEAVSLYQSGVDILTPLGVSIEAARVDAAAGQSLTVPLASLHARLDQTQFEHASQIMHRSPEAESAQDVQTISADTVRAFQDMIDNAQENQAAANGTTFMTQEQRAAFDDSFNAWVGQIRESVRKNTRLLTQLGTRSNVDRFVQSNAEIMRKRALLEAKRTGRDPADMLQRVFLRDTARFRAWEAGRRGDTEAQIAAELEAAAIENENARSLRAKTRRSQRRGSDSGQSGQATTVQAPAEVEFSGENVWRPANRPEYTEEQLAGRRAQSTLDPEDQANWLETPRGRYRIRYEVWELADLLPSHDPFDQFKRMPEYPSIAQERAYHRVPAEQEKVRRNALLLNPRYLVSDSPDASSGPPVITQDGVVLGGNSRTMSMQLAFTRPDKLQEYRDYLAARAQSFGVDPASFSGMQAPVLVRVLQGGALSQEEMAVASNAFNQVSTEELDVVAEGVSKSRRIDSRILTEIGSALENYDSLREYMGSRESRDLVQMLIEREIIAPNQVGRMVNAKTGLLTATGKDLLESALRGLIVQDYDILSNASENMASVLRKLDRAILPLVQLKRAGGKWDMSTIVTKALQQIYRADATMPDFRLSDLPGYFSTGNLGGVDRDRSLRAVQAVALTLADGKTSVREAAVRFNVMASLADRELSPVGMASLVPREPVSPEQAFIRSFLNPVAVVDNKPVLNFRPEKNTRHAAMQWADENAGTLSAALGKLEKLAVDDKLSEEERNMYNEYFHALAGLDAETVAVYQPKLGRFFSYDRNADTLWQSAQNNLLVRDGITRKPDSATAKVVSISEDAVPEFESMKEFANWLKDMLAEGGNVLIKSTGQEARFSRGNVNASVKRSRSKDHRNAYAGLRQMVENAEYDHYERPDERHPDRGGQDVYYSALAMGDKLYSVKLKLDVVSDQQKAREKEKGQENNEDVRYKDHKLTKIEIAPALYRGWPQMGRAAQPADAINEVSLGVLRGVVKPSRIENYALYQDQVGPSVNDVLDQAEELHRGGVTSTQGNYIIDLFQNADLSTLLHEMGHVWFMELERAVREGYADETMRADFDKLCNWVGGLQNTGGLIGRLTVEQHEQLARGLEAYFLEGKAPSEELRGVFANFRKWLKRIYQTVASLRVKLNDEVRGVFDRMFATQEEVEEVAASNGFINLTTGELDVLGVSKSQQEYTRMVMKAAKEKAVERLQAKRDTERRERMKEYYRRARKEVSELPVYQAMKTMKDSPLDAIAMRTMLGDETVAALQAKGITFTELGGQDPTIFAARYGFDSVESLATGLLQAGDMRQAARRRMMEMSDEYDAKFSALDELLESAELVEHASLVARHLAKVGNRPYIQQSAINQVVDNLSANKTVSELMRVPSFLSNMRSALKKERIAIAQGDFLAAIEANTQARLNLEMARRAKNLRDRTEKLPRRVKRFLGAKVVPEIAKYGLMVVASNHGVVPVNKALSDKYSPEDFNGWLKGVQDNGFNLMLDERTLVTFNGWQQMNWEQFEDLEDTLSQIITLERNQRKLLTSKNRESLEEAATSIASSVKEHGDLHELDTVNGENRLLSKLKRFHVAHMKIEELCIQMDGGVVGGPVWTHIYKPIADAENRQVLRLKEVRNYIRHELFGKYYSKSELVEMGSKKHKVLVPEIGVVMNKEQRLAVALNMGNATNMDRLRSGHGWNDEQIQAIVSTLDERDWQFVQAVWDYFDTFRPESFALQERLTGARPRAVVAQPFQVRLAGGKTISMRGGYYPIKYNPDINSKVFARNQEEMDKELMGGRNYSFAMTRHGHLKERTKEGVQNAPLLLNLGVIPEHLYNTVHDICYRPAVIDVNRIIRHDKVREAIESYAGREIYRALRPWLVDCANESTVQQSDIYAGANWARASMSIGTMGFKVTTILTQMAGLTTTVDVLGARWTARGVARVLLRNPVRMRALWEETRTRSSFMAGRLESFDRDMRDTAKRLQRSRAENVLQTVRETAFTPMAYMQLWSVDMPTWWGAYEKGLQDFHGDEAMAVDYADSMVRQTQGSGSTKDLSAIQRGNDLQRLFTMYYSFFNVLYNLGARHIKALRADHSPAGIWRASVHALLLWFLPVTLSELLAGRWGGDDEDESTVAWLARLWLAYPFQSIIGVRDIVNATSSGFGYQLSPASAPPEAIVKAMRSIGKAVEEEDPAVLVKPVAQAIAYGFMLPGGQASITLENLYDYFSDPDSEFYVRDLFFRKPADRR